MANSVELYTHPLFNKPSLISYWRMEGNSNDSKGSNNGTDTSITYNTGNGKFGQGAGLVAASSSKIVIADTSTLKVATPFTLMVWAKSSTTGTNKCLFNCEAEVTNYGGYALRIDTSNHLVTFSGKNTGTTQSVDYESATGTTNVCDGTYHLIFMNYNGSTLKTYVDNVQDSTVNWTNAPAYQATNYIRIGCKNIAGTDSSFFDGAIDDVALWGESLLTTQMGSIWDYVNKSRSFLAFL